MGQDKALLRIDGQPLLVRVLQRLAKLSDDLIVAAGDAGRYEEVLRDAPPVRQVLDCVSGAGPLGGMCAGLRAARYEQAVVVACDMPFVNVALLEWMAGLLPGYDAVVPRFLDEQKPDFGAGDQKPGFCEKPGFLSAPGHRAKDAGLQPMHAVYSRACVEPIQAALARGERSVGTFLASLHVHVVDADEMTSFDPHHLSLRNVNTPEEYAECLRLL